MTKLTVSLAACDYDRTRALFNGKVSIAGCDVVATPMAPEEAFHRAFRFQEFDITELSLSTYMNVTDRGTSHYTAIPVFPSRLFRHSSIYVRTDRGIEKPEDLKGKTLGVPEYQMTAAVWIRGILQDEYGVKPADIRWRNGGLEQPGRKQNVPLDLPNGVELQAISNDETLAQQLDEGKIDGLVTALAPSCFGKNPLIRRLFVDYRTAEEEYFRRTGIFPIMHVVGIRKSLLAQHPWLAVNTYVAFLEAKRLCYRDMEKIGHVFTTLPWPVEELKRARELMGEDFWSYGVQQNARELEAITRYAHEQGLTQRRLALEDLFAPSTFDLAKV
jgi:4,5-dihydroxyphthalate decarboxylase